MHVPPSKQKHQSRLFRQCVVLEDLEIHTSSFLFCSSLFGVCCVFIFFFLSLSEAKQREKGKTLTHYSTA